MSKQRDDAARSIFNIGSQQAVNLNNVAGDMTIVGGQHGEATITIATVYRDIQLLREGLQDLPLPPRERQVADQALDRAMQEVAQAIPNKRKIASYLEEVTQILGKFGALAGASAALVEPLQRLSSWLGPVGRIVLHLLP